MPLTATELLTPRYICTNTYPDHEHGANIQIGDVLTARFDTEKPEGGIYDYKMCRNDKIEYACFWKPLSVHIANFRLLHWSENRLLSDMPEYVKLQDSDRVYKSTWFGERGHVACTFEDSVRWAMASDCTPATEQEYNDYITKQNNQ